MGFLKVLPILHNMDDTFSDKMDGLIEILGGLFMGFFKVLPVLHIMSDTFCKFSSDKMDGLIATRSSLIVVRLRKEPRKWKLSNSIGYKPWFVMFRIFNF